MDESSKPDDKGGLAFAFSPRAIWNAITSRRDAPSDLERLEDEAALVHPDSPLASRKVRPLREILPEETSGRMFNVVAKHLRFGINRLRITAIEHDGLPGVLCQQIPVMKDGKPIDAALMTSNPYPTVVVANESHDLVLTFDNRDSALGFVNAVLSVVGFEGTIDHIQPPEDDALIHVKPGAERVIRAIERATLAARIAGATAHGNAKFHENQTKARYAENEAIRTVLQEFRHIPVRLTTQDH